MGCASLPLIISYDAKSNEIKDNTRTVCAPQNSIGNSFKDARNLTGLKKCSGPGSRIKRV